MASLGAYALVGLAVIAVPAIAGGLIVWWAPDYALRKLAKRYPKVVWFVDPVAFRSIDATGSTELHLNPPEDNSAWSVLTYILPNKMDLFDPAIKQRNKTLTEHDKVIALSLDDGPDVNYTLEILDVLRRYNCTATMFFIGQNLVDFVDAHIEKQEDESAMESAMGSATSLSSIPIFSSDSVNLKLKDLDYAKETSQQASRWQYKLPKSPEHVERIRHFVDYIESLGHEVGNHTWFDRRTSNLTLDELEQEMDWLDEILFSDWHPDAKLVTHAETAPVTVEAYLNHSRMDSTPVMARRKRKLFRPGHGYFNDAIVSSVGARNYTTIIGSVYPHDPHIPVPHITSFHVLQRARPGAIIALHDARAWSVNTIERVVKGLTAQGYRVVSVGELMDWGDVNGHHPGGEW